MADVKSPGKPAPSPPAPTPSCPGVEGEDEVYKTKVKSCVRVRPFKGDASQMCIRPAPRKGPEKIVEILTPDDQQAPQNPFRAFDEVFWSINDPPPPATFATNKDVFERVGKPCIEKAFKGINSVVFAYGQTASGKSYTMGLGDAAEKDPGLIPLLVDDLFAQIKAGGPAVPQAVADAGMHRAYEVKLAYFEVYDDHLKGGKVKDLNPFSAATAAELQSVRKEVQKLFDAQGGRDPKVTPEQMKVVVAKVWKGASPEEIATRVKLIFDYRDRSEIDANTFSVNMRRLQELSERDAGVIAMDKNDLYHDLQNDEWVAKGLAERPVTSLKEVKDLIQSGTALRKTGTTDFNMHSSRSHAVVQLRVDVFYVQKTADGADEKEPYTSATVSLVDLAGSERVSKAGASRLSETKSINTSLMYLGQVIDCASDKNKADETARKMRMVTLTRLISSSFGGNCEAWMMACVNPAMSEFSETLSTLNYAGKAREIVNSMRQNKTGDAATSAKLAALREKLLAKGSGASKEELKKMQDEIEALSAMQNTMKEQLKADRDALEAEQAQIRELEAEREKEAEEFRSTLNKRELEITKTQDDMRSTKARLEKEQDAVAKLQAQQKEKEEEFEKAKADQDAWLERELAQIQQTFATSEERAAAAAAARETHHNALEQVKERLDATEKQLVEAKSRATSLQEQVKALKDGDSARAKELAEEQKRLEEKLREKSEVERRNQYIQLDLEQVERELAELQEEMPKKEAAAEEARSQLAERRAELQQLDEKLQDSEKELAKKEEALVELEKNIRDVEALVQSFEADITKRQEELKKRKAESEEKQEQVQRAHEALQKFLQQL